MVEFNPDGSIKLPDSMLRKKESDLNKMKFQRCALFKKELVSTYAPKKCIIHMTLSDAIKDNAFVSNILPPP